MIIKNNTDATIERHKSRHGLKGDVYLVDGHLLESLESHKAQFPDSKATTIEEAEAERIAYEEELREAQRLAAEEAQANEQASEDEVVITAEVADGE